jgi:hypothetical protein
MSDDACEIKDENLKKLFEMFGADMPKMRVGILGSKAARGKSTPGKGANNAEIGAKHEFGEDGSPSRSFLRVPIEEHLYANLTKSGKFTPEMFKQMLKEKSLKQLGSEIAIEAKGIVLDAFNTGGDGKWKPSDMTKKKNQQTLIETGQLRDSITWDIKE